MILLLSKKDERLIAFDNWLVTQSLGKINYSIRTFSQKFGSFGSIYIFPIWFISSLNNAYEPVIEKFDVLNPLLNLN